MLIDFKIMDYSVITDKMVSTVFVLLNFKYRSIIILKRMLNNWATMKNFSKRDNWDTKIVHLYQTDPVIRSLFKRV